MKFLALLCLFLPTLSLATPGQAVETYAAKVFADYSLAVETGRELETKLREFTAVPTDETLLAAKEAWLRARSAYSPTEVYRFYQGPIDDENGPEGLLNAWPLDEAYIDYVAGNSEAGIINNRDAYPEITAELLVSLNEKDGETNISTGYHAIEFLLWGQDFSTTGPGSRPVSDYTSATNADRRAAYLNAAAALLVSHLEYLRGAWDPATGAYAAEFLQPRSNLGSLKSILLGAFRLAGEELAHERMFVAYDAQQQEDEHSCFSDNTHNDIRDNFLGIKNVISGGPMQLVQEKDADSAAKLQLALNVAEQSVNSVPAPFDQAIFSEEGRAAILLAVTSLEDLATAIKESSAVLGITLE